MPSMANMPTSCFPPTPTIVNNPPSIISSYPSPSFPNSPLPINPFTQFLSLPTLSDFQKLTPNNYHKWIMFMQLFLKSVNVWTIIEQPYSQSFMDARLKNLLIPSMSSSMVSQLISTRSMTQQLWLSKHNLGEC